MWERTGGGHPLEGSSERVDSGLHRVTIIQGLFPRAFARRAKWGYNGGWQQEIAIWNVGMPTTIAALRREGRNADRGLTAGFTVLSALFGANHLCAAIHSPRRTGNWIAAAANGAGLSARLGVVAAGSTQLR
jgi:hypothetical protein